MKKVYVFFTIIFIVVAISAFSQDSPKSFKIKKENDIRTGKPLLHYIDIARKEQYPSPKDETGKNVELLNTEINSNEKLYQIGLKIFNPEEIKYLETDRGYADCIISSSGKIISVSFYFHGWETRVPVTKLQEYASQIKENITLKLTYSKNPAKEGYYIKFIPIFRSMASPKNVKSKVGN